jgi:hypothetical protein
LESALGGAPSHWACYRFGTKLRKERERIAGCLDALTASLREQYPDMGSELAIDASDIPAYGNGQKFLYNGGPERQAYGDPNASWGHRSAVSTRKGGGFYGYRIHPAVCAATGLPLAWQVETARSHESMHVASLLDALHVRGFTPKTVAMDMGYDDNTASTPECAEREAAAIIPLRRARRNATSASLASPTSGAVSTAAAQPWSASSGGSSTTTGWRSSAFGASSASGSTPT